MDSGVHWSIKTLFLLLNTFSLGVILKEKVLFLWMDRTEGLRDRHNGSWMDRPETHNNETINVDDY